MNKVDYRNYLQSNHWKDFRTLVRIKCACNECQICGSTYRLDIHHLNYEHLWKERLSDVIVLCNKCHTKYHDGEIPKGILEQIAKLKRLKPAKYKTIRGRDRVKRKNKQADKVKSRFEEHKRKSENSIKKLGTIEYYRRKREGLL